ncbi:MAG: T9SS type A sorting domain-containing protein [Bacteroidetes bacterium]|nr:T9SS type A sorting domain-containing protein [Bacteroidota bacterium]
MEKRTLGYRPVMTACILLMHWAGLSGQNDQWSQLGMVKFPENPSVQTTGMGRVSHLVFHPADTATLFAVSASGGLWKTINEGQTWRQLTDGLPNTACASACINFKNPNTLYLGTGDANYYGGGLGVWKSTDGGKTWVQKNSGMGNVLVVQMRMHPTDTNILVATTKSGIYKTTNGGNTWAKKSTLNDDYDDLVVKPGKGYSLYATSRTYFYHSQNFGESWTRVNVSSGDTFSGLFIGVTPADTNLVYTVAWRSKSWGNKTYFGGLFKSSNAGLNWKKQSSSPQILGYSSDGSSNNGQGAYNLTMTVDPRDPASVYVGAICIWKSRDSGQTWQLKSPWAYGVHADKHHFIFSPHNPKKLYIAHDGGLDRSMDTGNTWKTLSDGLSASEFYRMGQSSLNREKAIGGLQDNGLNLYKNGVFYTIRGGDYTGEFLFDYQDSNYQYFQGGGNQYNLNTLGSRGINGQNNSVYELHRKDTNIAWMGYHMLYRTNNLRAGTVSWTQLSDSLLHYGTATTTAMAQSKANNNILYWARNNGVLYRVDYANSSKPVFTVLNKPGGNVQQITTHARDSNVAYMTIGGKIYKSSNKGNSWWDFSKNLPGNYIVSFQTDDRATDSSVYVATNFGVYYKNRSMSQWQTISKNLPAIAGITDMEIYNDGTTKSCLRISTYGRGLWQTSLYGNQTKAPVAELSVCPSTSACAKYYILNDVSTGGKFDRKWTVLPYGGYRYINGTDSLSRQPEIQFTKTGLYTVTLTVSNSYGNSTATETLQYSELAVPATCTVNTSTFGNYLIGVHRFEMAGIDKSSNFSLWTNPNLEDFSCQQTAMVKPGNTYTVWVTNGTLNNEYAALFIDYNNDGDFLDANELAATWAQGKGRRSVSVKILNSPPVVNTYLRMRVVSDFNAVTAACGNLSYGQAEDYSLFIDNKKPQLVWNMPKPRVYGRFAATLKLSEYCPGFDTGKIKLTNAKFTAVKKLNPYNYEFEITPLKPGNIYVNCTGGSFTDPVGNPNFSISDSTLFEMGLLSFSFPGHSKYDSLVHTDTGGRVTCFVYTGTKTDSLIATFGTTDSTRVWLGATVQTSGITMNDFRNPRLFTLKNPDGAFSKRYSVRVVLLPDTACELLSFAFQNPAVTGSISAGSVNLTVPYGTQLKNRPAYTTISPKATLLADYAPETSGSTLHDFRYPVLYRVVAEDTHYHKEWWVYTQTAKNTACDLLSWELVNPVKYGNLDTAKRLGTATLPFGQSRKNGVAVFTLSDSAVFTAQGVKQLSGSTALDYTDTVTGIVTSQDGKHNKTYRFVVSNALNDACELLTYELVNPAMSGTIVRDTSGGKIAFTVPENTNITSLVAQFTLSDSARIFIASTPQISGLTPVDFTSPVTYTVRSQSGIESKTYEVTVTRLLGWYAPSLDAFDIFPNPAKQRVYIQARQHSAYDVKLYDATGRLVLRGKNLTSLDLRNLQPGVYELSMEGNFPVQTKKLIVE